MLLRWRLDAEILRMNQAALQLKQFLTTRDIGQKHSRRTLRARFGFQKIR